MIRNRFRQTIANKKLEWRLAKSLILATGQLFTLPILYFLWLYSTFTTNKIRDFFMGFKHRYNRIVTMSVGLSLH